MFSRLRWASQSARGVGTLWPLLPLPELPFVGVMSEPAFMGILQAPIILGRGRNGTSRASYNARVVVARIDRRSDVLLGLFRAFYRSAASGTLGANIAHCILDVNDGHRSRISPPKPADDAVSGQPGMRLLEFISQQEFSAIQRQAFGHDGLVRWRTGHPGSAGVEFAVQYELAAGEAEAFGSAKRTHDEEKFPVEYSFRLGGRICGRCLNRRSGEHIGRHLIEVTFLSGERACQQ